MFSKLIRLGRDAELRRTNNGKQVLNFTGAYSVGFGENKRTQWIECALWGDRGANVQPHLAKGCQVVIYADDLECETFQKQDGTVIPKLKCRIVNFDFAGGRDQGTPSPQYVKDQVAPQPAPPQPQQAAPQQQYQQPPPQNPAPPQTANQAMMKSNNGGFDDFDDDIPF